MKIVSDLDNTFFDTLGTLQKKHSKYFIKNQTSYDFHDISPTLSASDLLAEYNSEDFYKNTDINSDVLNLIIKNINNENELILISKCLSPEIRKIKFEKAISGINTELKHLKKDELSNVKCYYTDEDIKSAIKSADIIFDDAPERLDYIYKQSHASIYAMAYEYNIQNINEIISLFTLNKTSRKINICYANSTKIYKINNRIAEMTVIKDITNKIPNTIGVFDIQDSIGASIINGTDIEVTVIEDMSLLDLLKYSTTTPKESNIIEYKIKLNQYNKRNIKVTRLNIAQLFKAYKELKYVTNELNPQNMIYKKQKIEELIKELNKPNIKREIIKNRNKLKTDVFQNQFEYLLTNNSENDKYDDSKLEKRSRLHKLAHMILNNELLNTNIKKEPKKNQIQIINDIESINISTNVDDFHKNINDMVLKLRKIHTSNQKALNEPITNEKGIDKLIDKAFENYYN